MRGPTAVALLGLATYGCGPEAPEPPYKDHDLGVLREGLTVGQAGGCDTSIAKALSDQLVAELNCIAPGSMASFLGQDVSVTSAVEPYLEPGAAADLHLATAQQGAVIGIDSAYRSLAQQYMLYAWWQQGLCGIQLAAAPGNSNHQSGRAIDVPSYSSWMASLQTHGWTWFGSADVVHFDHLASADRRADSVLAFQRLWNINNPANLLAEDSVYGSGTATALASTSVTGFAVSGCGGADAGQDAGSAPDGGASEGDAGPGDGGSSSGGPDAGKHDAGAADAGAPDGGAAGGHLPDAGSDVRTVSQGCSTGGAPVSLFGLCAVLLALRRRPIRSHSTRR